MTDYETLGVGYAALRRPDPRLQRAIDEALGDARTVLNVGAGAGSYEPRDRDVLAIEPSLRMLRQRAADAAPAVCATAEALPLRDGAFAAAMATLTIHHWRDWRAGIAEMARAARRLVVLTWDPQHDGFWLARDYCPALHAYDRRIFPPLAELADAMGGASIEVVPIPHDCSDGFLGAYWQRPAAYLDPVVRRSISSFARLPDVDASLARLAADLADGSWDARHRELRTRDALDLGYRLVVGGGSLR
jgi:SAM-dependent methyltransferase